MSMGDRMTAPPEKTKERCNKCGKVYIQIRYDQASGFRQLEEDVCPYCGNVNHKSMSTDFVNYPLV